MAWSCGLAAVVGASGSSVELLGAPHECARCFTENERLTSRIEQLLKRVDQLEAELARLQQLCDTQEGELTIYKMTEAASSTRLEGACKMIEQASARMQALENDKVRLEGELRASEEQRKTFETTVKAEHAAELRALAETLAQVQLSAESKLAENSKSSHANTVFAQSACKT